MNAVGMHPIAVNHSLQYRPHEIAANQHIIDGAGDAGGISLDLATEIYRSGRSLDRARVPQW